MKADFWDETHSDYFVWMHGTQITLQQDRYGSIYAAGSADTYRCTGGTGVVVGLENKELVWNFFDANSTTATDLLSAKHMFGCTASAPMGPNWGGELRRVLVSSQ